MCAKCLFYMVRSDGVEPPTYWFVASCSIQLSYERVKGVIYSQKRVWSILRHIPPTHFKRRQRRFPVCLYPSPFPL